MVGEIYGHAEWGAGKVLREVPPVSPPARSVPCRWRRLLGPKETLRLLEGSVVHREGTCDRGEWGQGRQ